MSGTTSIPISQSKSTIHTRNLDLVLHCWKADNNQPSDEQTNNKNNGGVAIVFHGFAAHANYPTVKYASELLCNAGAGLTVYSADMQGHGESTLDDKSDYGLLPPTSILIQDAITVTNHVLNLHTNKDDDGSSHPSLFLVGSSMGGALALQTSIDPSIAPHVTGLVMLAPLLSLKVSSIEQSALSALSSLIPTWAVIPSSSTSSSAQYRDTQRRQQCDDDTMSYKGKMKVQSALTCVELAKQTRTSLDRVSCPFLIMIGSEDVVVDNTEAAKELMENAKTDVGERMLKEYKALHGLLCETQPLRGEIERDLMDWVNHRCA